MTDLNEMKKTFDKWTQGMPPLDHLWKLIERLDRIDMSLGDIKSIKKMMKATTKLYPDLLLLEQFHALKNSSSSATLATKESHPELYRIFEEAYAAHTAYSQEAREIPRLVVMESDFPNMAASVNCQDKQTIYITSKILDILNRDEIKGGLLHEFGHINRDCTEAALIAPTMIEAILTRNDSRRMMEYAADSYAIKCGTKPEVLSSGMQKINNYANLFASKMNEEAKNMARSTLVTAGIKGEKFAKLVTWVVDKKTKALRDRLTSHERRTTFMERLCDAPTYPTVLERDEALLGKTEGFNR